MSCRELRGAPQQLAATHTLVRKILRRPARAAPCSMPRSSRPRRRASCLLRGLLGPAMRSRARSSTTVKRGGFVPRVRRAAAGDGAGGAADGARRSRDRGALGARLRAQGSSPRRARWRRRPRGAARRGERELAAIEQAGLKSAVRCPRTSTRARSSPPRPRACATPAAPRQRRQDRVSERRPPLRRRVRVYSLRTAISRRT